MLKGSKLGSKTRTSSGKKSSRKFKGIPRWKKSESVSTVVARGNQLSGSATSDSEIPCHRDSASSDPVQRGKSCETEENPAVVTSASLRKLGEKQQSDQAQTEGSDQAGPSQRQTRSVSKKSLAPKVSGYRVTDIENMCEAMKQMHSCKSCKINVKELNRYGLGSTLVFECSVCGHQVHMDTSKKVPGTVKCYDVNRRSVYSAGELGIGREGLAILCDIMNLPYPLYDQAFQSHAESIHRATKSVLDTKLALAAKKLKEFYKTEYPDNFTEGSVLNVPVSFDGTWSKRGFTANFGIGFGLSSDTGEVLDYCVLSKVCNYCNQSKKLNKTDPEKYESWKEQHEESGKCQKNFSGSSSAMEPAAAKIIWSRSVDKHGLRYTDMVCDGDSKSYNDVWDVYGICGNCEEFEGMNKKSAAYQEWLKSDECKQWEEKHWMGETNCNRVSNLDCIGHVQKRMGKNLIELTKKTRKLDDGKAVGGRADRLTRPCIDNMQNYYGNAIRKNVDRSAKTRAQVDTVLEKI